MCFCFEYIFLLLWAPLFSSLTLDFNGTWILNISCKISNINVHIKCHVLAALLFHFHQFARFGSVFVRCWWWSCVGVSGQWRYFFQERGSCMKKLLIGLGLFVPVLCSSDCWRVCTDSWNTGNKFCQWKGLLCASCLCSLCIIESLRGLKGEKNTWICLA